MQAKIYHKNYRGWPVSPTWPHNMAQHTPNIVKMAPTQHGPKITQNSPKILEPSYNQAIRPSLPQPCPIMALFWPVAGCQA